MTHRIALALLLTAAVSAHAVQDCDIAGQHVNPANGNTTAGKTGLMRCKDRDTGQLQREQELQDGKFMGLVRFYDHGQLSKEYSVNERGNRHGRSREFAPGGQVIVDINYANGDETGMARRFHTNGQLRRASFYNDGEKAHAEFNDRGQLSQLRCSDKPLLAPVVDDAKLCGFAGTASQFELFDSRGSLSSRNSYLAGQRVRYEQLYDDGKTQLLQENGPARQIERQFSRDGVKRRDTERTLDGKTVTAMRLQQFSETGTLVRDQRWAAGRQASDTSFYLNGQPKTRQEWGGSGTASWIDETDYRDDGSVASTGRYLEPGRGRRQATGTHKVFNAAGKVVAEAEYDARGRIARERAWDDGGTLVRDDAVFEDGSRKAFAR